MHTITHSIVNMENLKKNNWLSEGLKIIESKGFTRITVDYLCERVKRSKGSFYFHFKNIDGYIQALMDFWVEKDTLSIIHKANTANDKEKKQVLYQLSVKKSLKLEQYIRAWGFSNETVRKMVEKADDLRMESIVAVEVNNGKKTDEAKDIAVLTYSAFVGIQQLFPYMPKKEKLRLEQLFSSKF